MKFISELLANLQVERLESLIVSARARARQGKQRSGSIVCEHLNLAEEHLDEAISAMKYHRFDQASFACQSGFMQFGLAELLLRFGDRLDAGMQKAMAAAGKKERASEEEELAAYLASILAQMKVAIEYSNCTVSDRARAVLDHAMDYYNDSLKAIKHAEIDRAKNCAQAGLLNMLLASELISAENQMALPGWRGLSNPMLVSPLRRASQLAKELAQTRLRLHKKEMAAPDSLSQEEAEKNVLLRKHWEKAYNEFYLAVQSLSSGSLSHARALLKAALREMEVVRDIIGIEDPDELKEEYETPSSTRTPVTDAISVIAEVKAILADAKIQRKEYALTCLEKVERLYKEAIKYYEKAQFDRAEKCVSDALMDLDLLRQQVHFRKQKFTGNIQTRQ